ncbi:Pao retrotransposon peptidase [Nesidiocoris tenuis]|uniref:Pao retrotransposon peptidase n=3 Tax=Nesidiocoris tenuis TaxID=355587 RepID=A0ABN7AKN0_9HEMI|nr:Pao retrotransposon peptidase [Nesidiocoris tenuis]
MASEPAEPKAPRKPPGLQSIASELNLSEVTIGVVENGVENSLPQNAEAALDELIELLLRLMNSDEPELLKVSSVLNFLKSVGSWENFGRRHLVQNMVADLTDKILAENTHQPWKSCMIQIVTKFVQTTHFNEHSSAGLRLLEYLLAVSLKEEKQTTAANIKRIKDLKEFILALEIVDSSASRLLPLFQKALVSEAFLKRKEGIVVLAYFMSKEKSLVKSLQAIIRANLENQSKDVARAFGDLYFHSWILADGTPVQEEIENWAIQDIMVRAMTLNRPGVKTSKLGTNVFHVLKAIRANRRSKKFSGVVTKLYQPIIWRSLKSHNALERCNATQIFFDVFPLEKVNEGAYENKLFIDQQVKEIKDLLLDDCPFVRVLAIRGMGSVLLSSTDIIGVTDLADILKILAEKLVFDGSSPHVRAEVFNMFESIMTSPPCRTMVITMMKQLQPLLFDESKEVRKAFVKVLLKWSETDDPESTEVSAWDVVPSEFVLECLAQERETEVGALLAKHVFPNVFSKNQSVEKTVKRLIKIMKVNQMALMNLFVNSKKLIDAEDAFTIIVSVLSTLGLQMNKKMEEIARQGEEMENADETQPPRRKKSKSASTASETDTEEPAPAAQPQQQCLLDNHKIVIGLLNGVCSLWVTLSDKLENSSHRDDLIKLAISQVPRFAKYFRGTPVYYAVVSFASLLPVQDLSKQSTIVGASISELKQMNVDSDLDVMNCLVTALCFWSRSSEIIDLAMDWLNETFRHEDLNTTAVQARQNKKRRTVRFKPETGKPMMAVHLLQHMFQHVLLRPKILSHGYAQLMEFFRFLERIKDLVERRINRGEPWDVEDLKDEVLLKCFALYLSMISMLHRPEGPPVQPTGSSESEQPPFVAANVSNELVNWANNELVESAKTENGELGFASQCLIALAKNAQFVIEVNKTSREHCIATLELALKISCFASADQDHQRIFWRFSPADSLSEFRLTTVTYGNAAAPFLALRTMKQLVYDEGSQFPMAAKALLNNTFVDDTCISVPTVHDALKLQAELVALLAKGKFSLKKWLSNRPQLLKNIPEEDRAMKTEILSFRGDDGLDPGTNILGLSWNPATDQFSFKIEPLKEMIVTKRTILAEVSRLYDPLGFLCPVTFYGKWLIQHLWSSGLGWDETPSEEIVIKWKQYHSELPLLSQVQIPRCVELDSAVSVQLHGFCDSSQRGYAGVVYLRNINKNGKITCSLLVAKSKVAPLKRISLPRLELCGAVLVTDLLHYAKEMLKDHVSIQSTVVWCDSMVSLQWIKASPHKWKTFIANRVSQIHERLAPDCFRYVPSASNPSDIASRGALPMQFLSDRSWLSGPDWLIGPPEKWPKVPPLLKSEEVMAEAQIVSLPLNSEITPIESWLENYSSFTSLKRHTAFLLRYFKYLRDPHADSLLTGGLTTDELKLAVIRLVRFVQSQVFSSEIKLLSEGKLIASKFRKLNPFLDDDSIIRVGGRLKHAPIPSDQKHPMLLPKAHHFTHLVVDHFHLKYLHAGPLLVQSLIRAEFWIVNSREVIRNRLSRCVTCFKTKPKEQEHLMGDLPTSRLEPISAFYRCSCDYGGPYRIKASSLRNAKVTKAYICLFVCFTTRAIHLELVSDLTTDAFIAALRRFVGRRGSVSEIQSDCGTNFVGAKHKLEDWSKFVSSKQHNSQVEKCLSEEGITWKLCAPGSPHLNGLAEAGIKSIKTHLTKVIGEQTLTYEEFYTILTQIEAVVNSRPITQVSSDPNDLQALTPGHFLMQRPAFALVGPEPENLNITKRWKLVQKLLHSFWDRWRKDYLGGLQTRSKWTKEFNNLKVDDLVIMKEPNLSPSQWKMARITKVLPGEDGIVRVAEVKTAQGTFTRSVRKLCPLPLA